MRVGCGFLLCLSDLSTFYPEFVLLRPIRIHAPRQHHIHRHKVNCHFDGKVELFLLRTTEGLGKVSCEAYSGQLILQVH